MAKLALLTAAFALLLLVANASIYSTTVEIDEDDNQNQGMCRREFQRHQQLRACQRFMRRRVSPGGYADDLEDDLADEAINQRRPLLRQCCNQLRQVDRQCVCPVLGQAIQQQRLQGQIRGEQMREMYSIGKNLPNMCNVPAERCQFGPSLY